jgi:uncharacterized membrane protein
MRKLLSLIPVLLAALALTAAAPVSAGAATGGSTATVQTQQARFGGGFRGTARRPSFGSRPRYRSPGYRRSHPFRGVGGSILRALGIAYLFHAIFGWGGGGGSPLGLLIIVAVIAWIVMRRRRRPFAY